MNGKFETHRMYLREWNVGDAPFIFELNNDPEVVRFTGDQPFESISSAEDFLLGYDHYMKWSYGRWLCVLKENNQPIGWCGLKNQMEELGIVDLGYRFVRNMWGKGYATEAAQGTIAYGFSELYLSEITGRVAIGNDASERILLKCGFQFWKESTCEHHPAKWYKLSYKDWLVTQQLRG